MTTTPEPPQQPDATNTPSPTDAPSGFTPQVSGPTGASSLGGSSSKAGWALGLGILGLLCFGFIIGIVAIVFGVQARREIKASGNQLAGEGMATTGIVLGVIDIVAWIGWLAWYLNR